MRKPLCPPPEPCRSACRASADAFSCGCAGPGGYLIERILYTRECRTAYDGQLVVEGLPDCLCPPLSVCALEAVEVRPMAPDCGCSGGEKLEILLRCVVFDARRRSAEGYARIVVSANTPCGQLSQGCSIRRGAQVNICRADSLDCGRFSVCLDVVLRTIVTRLEVCGGKTSCDACPPPLPLYPKPCVMPYRRC